MQKKEHDLFMRKIGRRKDEIRRYFASNVTPITDVVYRETKAYERYEDAVKAKDFKPIKVGEHWGGGCNGWFKISFVIPRSLKGKEVAAYFDFGGESCAFIDGKPYQGIDGNHKEVLLTKSAKGGEQYDIVVDAASSKPWDPNESRKVHFSRAEFGTRNMEVQEFWFNLEILHLLAEQLPFESARKVKIVYLLNKAVDAFDYDRKDEANLRKSAMKANAILRPLLHCKAEASATDVAVHGHSHIDVAWLWPYRETLRKCSRTFSSVMRLMEQYPEYIFTQSQAQLYEFTKDTYPALYEDIKKAVKAGRWDVQGSMWVEADCNLSGGESLVRQVLVAKNFFKDEFGIETNVLWLPDVFGYSAALPQILQKSRVPYFSTIKISWSQFNKFPFNTFNWKGIDGTSVLAHFPPTGDYNAYPNPAKLRHQVNNFAEKDRCDWSLLSYGWGDGGGGPDRRHLELLGRSKDLEGLPRCHQMKVKDFFRKIDGAAEYPEWVGELYLELHRGTYTTQGHNKRNNRKAELMYRDVELLSSVADTMGLPYPREELLRNWKRILCQQFHDVIPGSSIRQVYEDTDIIYPEIFEAGNAIADAATAKIVGEIDTSGDGDAIVTFNTLPWGRTDIASAKLPAKGNYAVLDTDGKEVPSQIVDGEIRLVAVVQSMGYATYRLIQKHAAKFKPELKVSKKALENQFYKITLDGKGVISSIIEKASGREVIPDGAKANLFQLFEDKPNDWDAWDVDFYYEDKFEDITQLDKIEVIEEGPISGAVEMTRSFGSSKIKQKMVIYSDIPRIDFQTWVHWHEERKFLKVAFPVDVNTSKGRYEIQFGNVERPTHANTSWDVARFEVCAHKWADLSEEGFGMSLLNDCKYGHHTKGNVMRLSLLRAPKEPDPLADRGEHVFTYSILPHAGSYIEAQTVRQAYGLNVPLRCAVAKPAKGKLPKVNSFFAIDADNVVLEVVKKAEKGEGTILRFYECHGVRGDVGVKVDLPFKKIQEVDLMEDRIGDIESKNGEFEFEIKPFEIKTFRLI
jgi:alpha-mannosidase